MKCLIVKKQIRNFFPKIYHLQRTGDKSNANNE